MKRILFFISLLLFSYQAVAVDLRADTATTITIRLLDGTDGITPEASVTIAQADVRLWKEGGTTAAQKNDATSCTHREAGVYTCPIDATDTNTEGVLFVFTDESVNATTVVPWEKYYNVLGADEYDRKYGVTAALTSRQAGNALETTITTATTQLELDLAAGASNNDAYNNMTAVFVAGTEECHARVDDYTGSGAILFLDATANTCGGITLASADTVRIRDGSAGAAVEVAQLDLDVLTGAGGAVLQTNALTATTLDTTAVTEIIDAMYTTLATGTCDSGTNLTCVDAVLAEADTDYWADGTAIRFTSGTVDNQIRCVTGFTPGTDTLTFKPATTQAVSTNTYVLLAAPTCSGVAP